MRLLLAFSAASLLLAPPAFAATYMEQQSCMTWLSLAGHFGPEPQRKAYEERYRALESRTNARTDVPQEDISRDREIAIKDYTDWTMEYSKDGVADSQHGRDMMGYMMFAAAGCIKMVSDETLEQDPHEPTMEQMLSPDSPYNSAPLATPM